MEIKCGKPDKAGLPPVGTIISVPPLKSSEDSPASVCIHCAVGRPMCTIMEVEQEPHWFLSCWGNGPGFVCFLEKWDPQKPFFDVEIIKVSTKSVTGIPLDPTYSDEEEEEEEEVTPDPMGGS